MTNFLLMRHAEPDYSHPQKWGVVGWGNDLAPVTENGLRQVQEQIDTISRWQPELILISPTTRTMQTGGIVAAELGLKFVVEFDLHEWIPDLNFQWAGLPQVRELLKDFYNHQGEYPEGAERKWEPMSGVKNRVSAVLERYLNYERVLVVAHGIVIESLTGVFDPGFASLTPYFKC